MMMTATQAEKPSIMRAFWHGAPLSLYQLLCLRSFIDHGHRVELFTHGDDELNVPSWLERRDAREIFDPGFVLRYRDGFGSGSPSLHSNLLRYAILHRLGGWWIDCDVLLLAPDLPDAPVFIAYQADTPKLCGTSLIKFPAGAGLLEEAMEECLRVSESAVWGQTGPSLLTTLVQKHDLVRLVRPSRTVYPIDWTEIAVLFDPCRTDAVIAQCAQSLAIHLFNEVWRGAGLPSWLGPPSRSFLDRMFQQHDLSSHFTEHMRYAELERWIRNRNDAIVNLEKAADARRTAVQLETQLRTVHQSTSWRVTAPLRMFARLMSR